MKIEASKKQPLSRVIYALGFNLWASGQGNCWLSISLHSMNLQTAKQEQLEEVNEVGPKVAASNCEFFSEPANRQFD